MSNVPLSTAVPTVQIDNAVTRVTEWHFPPHSETGWHKHEMSYVVVPMTTGPLQLEHPDGSVTTSHLNAGQSYTRDAGVEHNVINPSDTPFTFVEIEFK
ncbi:cupin domain-containing protein [Paenalcaligenes niemegkensis]|uniref:cupin domain-containing protein n=1 Tax=Paenalcaligenes niemegkensis TaxID=2895469 RepID=UPI001EE88781|nr:cupin domain-containing protein [Paenalcaligenes niemegkensis]MCQ9618153.1 cupin domain-containing protein [Paenalcaligenes niemegkensis]